MICEEGIPCVKFPGYQFIETQTTKCNVLLLSSSDGLWPVGVVVTYMAVDVGGLGFDSQAGQIGHSDGNGSPPLRCFFGAVLLRR